MTTRADYKQSSVAFYRSHRGIGARGNVAMLTWFAVGGAITALSIAWVLFG